MSELTITTNLSEGEVDRRLRLCPDCLQFGDHETWCDNEDAIAHHLSTHHHGPPPPDSRMTPKQIHDQDHESGENISTPHDYHA